MSLVALLKRPGPSGFGYGSTAAEVTEGLDLSGKTYLVTGSNSGLGRETMRVLALRGAHVIAAARTEVKAAGAIAKLGIDATPVACELSEPDSVRACVEAVAGLGRPLDGIIANAGIMALPKLEQRCGYELQFFTNHVGHFILVTGLLDQLSERGRVVILSSSAHQAAPADVGIEFDNLSGEGGYAPWRAYGQSKLANLLFSGELQRRAVAQGTSLTSAAAHPGYSATNLTTGPAVGAAFLKPVLGVADQLLGQDDEMGALPQLYAATMSDVLPNDYWGPDGFREMRGHPKRVGRSQHALDDDVAGRLWSRSEELTAVTYPWP